MRQGSGFHLNGLAKYTQYEIEGYSMIATAEGLLHRWGKWSRDNPGLLFSTTNIIGRVMEEGAGASQPSGKPEMPMPRDIELTEVAVLKMADEIKHPIILKYVNRMPPGLASRECHIHPREYNKLVNFGIYFVAGFIAK